MHPKPDESGGFRNPYVRPLLIAVLALLIGWIAAETHWGRSFAWGRVGTGRLLPHGPFVRLAVPGITYVEYSFLSPPIWDFWVTRGLLPFGGAVLVALTELHRMRKIYLDRRRRPGHCPTCGYDLRASRGRCPECGQPIEGRGASVQV